MTTTYYNGWTKQKIWDYVESHFDKMRLVLNTDHGFRYDMGGGEVYEGVYTDYTPGRYPYTEKISINGVLAQVTRHD